MSRRESTRSIMQFSMVFLPAKTAEVKFRFYSKFLCNLKTFKKQFLKTKFTVRDTPQTTEPATDAAQSFITHIVQQERDQTIYSCYRRGQKTRNPIIIKIRISLQIIIQGGHPYNGACLLRALHRQCLVTGCYCPRKLPFSSSNTLIAGV